MAENNDPAEAPKKGKLKFILLLVLVIILAIGLSIAGTFWFLKNSNSDQDTAAEDESEVAEVFKPSQYYVIDKALVATLQSEGKQRYVQVHVAFEADEPAPLAAAQKHLPLLRSRLLSVLGAQAFSELQTTAGRNRLIAEMLQVVNQVLGQEGEAPVKHVLFRNFVVQ